MSNNLKIDLDESKDRNGKKFYVGKLQFPGDIDCREGVNFLVFVSDTGLEELQISIMGKEKEKPKNTNFKMPPVEYK